VAGSRRDSDAAVRCAQRNDSVGPRKQESFDGVNQETFSCISIPDIDRRKRLDLPILHHDLTFGTTGRLLILLRPLQLLGQNEILPLHRLELRIRLIRVFRVCFPLPPNENKFRKTKKERHIEWEPAGNKPGKPGSTGAKGRFSAHPFEFGKPRRLRPPLCHDWFHLRERSQRCRAEKWEREWLTWLTTPFPMITHSAGEALRAAAGGDDLQEALGIE